MPIPTRPARSFACALTEHRTDRLRRANVTAGDDQALEPALVERASRAPAYLPRPSGRIWLSPLTVVPVGIAGRLPGFLLAGGLGVAVLAAPDPGLTQPIAPSAVTPPSLRPLPEAGGGDLSVSQPAPLEPPADAANFDVLVDHVSVEGTFPGLTAQTKVLVDSVVGKRLTPARMYALASNIEAVYSASGYVLARVVVPPQQIDDHGTLRIVVIDGFIESIDLQGVPRRVRDVIAATVGWLVGHRHVTLAEIERALMIASDVPGVSLKSALAQGSVEGGTKLIVEGAQHLVTGTFGVDDRLPGSLGVWQYSANLAVNSPLGYGEQFYTTFGIGADLSRALSGSSPLKIFGGGVVVPLGADGITLNPEYTHTLSETVPVPRQIPSAGEFERYALRLAGPLIRSRATTLALGVSLEHIIQRTFIPSLADDISLDRYDVVRIGPDLTTTLGTDTGLETRFTVSRGLAGRSAAKANAARLPLSTFDAASDFTKFGGFFHITQPLPDDLRLDVIGNIQDSLGKPLMKAEQFALSGSDAVSAFADGTLNVDQGETIRAELGRRFVVPAFENVVSLTPYLVAAAGHGQLVNATQLEQPRTDVAALGIGAHGAAESDKGTAGAALDIELARQFTDSPSVGHGWRASVKLTLAF